MKGSTLDEWVCKKQKWKNRLYKDYIRNVRIIQNDYLKLQTAINVSEIIDKRKNDYDCHLASSLNSPKISAKTYSSILKSFYSGEKIPLISPLLLNSTLIPQTRGWSF